MSTPSTLTISFSQMSELHETLVRKGVTPGFLQDNLLGQGRIADLAEACVAGTIPNRDEFRKTLGLGPIFKTDKHGRILIHLVGRGWLAEKWLTQPIGLSDWAKDILGNPDYNENHRLEVGKQYVVALVLGREIKEGAERSTANLQKLAERDYGKSNDLRGELVFLIREAISNAQMKCLGACYIAVLHEPITDSRGHSHVFYLCRYGVEQWVRATCAHSDGAWDDDGMFAFPVSQAISTSDFVF